MKSVNFQELSDLVDTVKVLYKTFKDKLEMLLGYKEAIEKSEQSDKNSLAEGVHNYNMVLSECNEILEKIVEKINLTVKDYDNLDEFVTSLCLEEKDMIIRQNYGFNIYDFRKKIKATKVLEDIADLFRLQLDTAKIDLSLYGNNFNFESTKNNKINDVNIFIELDKKLKNDNDLNNQNNKNLQINFENINDINEAILKKENEKEKEKFEKDSDILSKSNITIKIPDFQTQNSDGNINENNNEIKKEENNIDINKNKNMDINMNINQMTEIEKNKIDNDINIKINKDEINNNLNENVKEDKELNNDNHNNSNEENISELNKDNKENKNDKDKVESLDTNLQSNDSSNNGQNEGN